MPARKKAPEDAHDTMPQLEQAAPKRRARRGKAEPAEAKPKPAAARKPRAPRKKSIPVEEALREPVVHAQPGDVRVSVVIPAYNEAERLPMTLVAAQAYFDARGEEYEVVVVDDGSSDRTTEIVERMRRDFPQLRLVRQPRNAGKGAAVARGMSEARGALRLFADADGSTPFGEFSKLEEALAEGAHVAFGSRAMPDSDVRPQPWYRVLLGKASNLVIQATNLPGVKDSQCGFKAFTASAADAIFPSLQTARWGFDIEILVLARRLGLPIREVGVAWEDKAGSTLRPSAYLQTLREDLRIRYNAITGAYPKR